MIYDTIQIDDPRKPGDYLVIAARDFDPAKHTRFGDAKAAPAKPEKAAAEDAPKPRRASRKRSA